MIEYLVATAVIGTAVAVIDQQNLIPQLSNNPQKKWIWDPSRYTPIVPPARFQPSFPRPQPIPSAVQSFEQMLNRARQGMVEQPRQDFTQSNQSKYSILK